MIVQLLFLTLLIRVYNIKAEIPDLLKLSENIERHITSTEKPDIHQNFVKSRKQRLFLNNFDKLISNETIYVDGILHLAVTPDWKKAHEIEKDFKDLITMKNLKYVYLRDDHWRTWRQIKDEDGKQRIICYMCQSKINSNCTECSTRGVWVIEEDMPPCPYEIFSVISSIEMCVANYTQLGSSLGECPTITKYEDLTKSCNNPIITRWRFTNDYQVSERRTLPNAICEGREYCEILTLYQIQPDYIIFRIINSTNSEIIYSRIMKNNQHNFACVNECGIIDTKTLVVGKVDENSKSTILDLLPRKSKRNVKKNKKTKLSPKDFYSSTLTVEYNNTEGRHYTTQKNSSQNDNNIQNTMKVNLQTTESTTATTTMSLCKKILSAKLNENKENNYDYIDKLAKDYYLN